MTKPVSSGGRANRRGRSLERYVRELLNEEYERVNATCFFAMRSLQQPIFAEQVETGLSIYGKKRIVDFALYHPQRWPGQTVSSSSASGRPRVAVSTRSTPTRSRTSRTPSSQPSSSSTAADIAKVRDSGSSPNAASATSWTCAARATSAACRRKEGYDVNEDCPTHHGQWNEDRRRPGVPARRGGRRPVSPPRFQSQR